MSRFAISVMLGVCACAAAAHAPVARAVTVTFGALKDNTLYETTDDSVSNGAGPGMFAGRTGTNAGTPALRRGLIAFDVSSIPSNAVIESATLTLNLSRAAAAGPGNIFIHRLTRDWGEGSSNAGNPGGGGAAVTPGDATWNYNFYNTSMWTDRGGDFFPGSSSARFISDLGKYNFNDSPMATDVAGWVANPGTNFGWIIRGNEETLNSAKRFDTRENPVVANRPVLIVTYSVPEPGGAMVIAGFALLGVSRRRARR
jgi:hypothetical protein